MGLAAPPVIAAPPSYSRLLEPLDATRTNPEDVIDSSNASSI
jgi:hypothetical protein